MKSKIIPIVLIVLFFGAATAGYFWVRHDKQKLSNQNTKSQEVQSARSVEDLVARSAAEMQNPQAKLRAQYIFCCD